MKTETLNELSVTSKSVLLHTTRRFTEALTDTPEFVAFEESYQAFRHDQEAQTIYKALQNKQQALRMMMMLNSLDEKERQELKDLENQFYQQETVQSYLQAQNNLISLCQEIGDVFSEAVGLDFGSSCRIGGCCG
jgi:cell fate (sporulation/competence/biofilm development) regulator YlbF (YheA/YmcA/DUF963 family)